MAWELRLTEEAQQRLKAATADGRQPSPGWLIGAAVDSTLAVLSTIQCTSFLKRCAPTASKPLGTVDEDVEGAELQMLVPAGLRVLGAYGLSRSSSPETLQAAADELIASVPAQLVDSRTPLVAAVAAGGALHWFVQHGTACELAEPAAPLPGSWLGDTFTLLRCYLPVRLEVFGVRPVPEEDDIWEFRLRVRMDAVAAAVERASAELTSPSTVFLANAGPGSPAVLYGAGTDGSVGGSLERPVSLTPLVRQSPPGPEPGPAAAPTLVWQPVKLITGKEPMPWHTALVRLDVLAYVRRGSGTAEAASEVLQPGIRAQLQVFRTMLDAERHFCEKGQAPPTLRALHFQPPSWCHAVSVVYQLPVTDDSDAVAAAEAQLAERRRQLHKRLGLPEDRPLMRVANALPLTGLAADEDSEGSSSTRLSDVHVGLPPAGIAGGSVHLISGSYDYHHYMQDKMDDKGWGCAYRSLQTLCSWFRRQHYTAAEPPSHRAIQTALVKLGDKEPAFVGCKQWVGTIELSYVLDSLLGVSSKIITVAKGADLPSKAREIAHHFDTQGTPIMVGGGVLAYTLLGIDFNARTGEAAFLILDPHYTGADDLKRIHAGQWVAWKRPGDKAAAGGDLFVKDAFYNLLCPQRPATV